MQSLQKSGLKRFAEQILVSSGKNHIICEFVDSGGLHAICPTLANVLEAAQENSFVPIIFFQLLALQNRQVSSFPEQKGAHDSP